MDSKAKHNIIVFNLCSFGFGICNAVFNFYYVKIYLDYYKIDPIHFYWAQVIFMIWNAINDPLIGYLQDVSKYVIFRSRRLSIYYGSFGLVLCFLLPWFPWFKYLGMTSNLGIGIHLCVSLCLYDTMFSYIGLAWSAAFTEMSSSQEVRRANTKFGQFSSLTSSSILLFTQYVTQNGKSIPALQVTAIFIAILGLVCLMYSGKHLKIDSDLTLDETSDDVPDWKHASIQILKNPNFICFVLVNFLQIFLTTFYVSFFSIFSRDFLPESDTKHLFIIFFSSIMFFMPQTIVLGIFGPLLPKYGAARVVFGSQMVTFFSPFFVFFIGLDYSYILILYMTLNSALARATFSLFNMLVSDIIDADTIKYKRSRPISSIVFGLNALITKPAHSLCPMLVVQILNRSGYQESADIKPQSVINAEFLILCSLPIVIALLQMLVWRNYSLKNTHESEKLVI